MKKILNKILLVSLLCVAFVLQTTCSWAGEIPEERLLPRLVDEADLLSVSEERELLEQLDEISERQEFDVAVVTVESLGGVSPRDFADDFYDYNGYGMGSGDDGALLLVSIEERDWYITTHGFGTKAITDAGLDYMSEKFLPELSDGDYAKGFEIYADLCDDFVTQAREGRPYDYGNMPKSKPGAMFILVALAVGLLLADIPTLIMRGKLKTVKSQKTASSYEKQGSRVIRVHSDRFLYHTTTRRRKETEHKSGGSSTHTSSSGRSHGGGGGKF